MIRRFGLSLALASGLAVPVLAQPPAPPMAIPPRPTLLVGPPGAQVEITQRPDLPPVDQQGGQRGFRQRNRGDRQGFGGQGGGRGFNRFGGGPANPQTPQTVAPTPPSPALAAQGRGPGPLPVAPPALPADVQTMRALQGSISAVFNPGAKSARIKLIETDDHGVEGLRTLKPGDLYRDGWRLSAVTATEATLRKGKSLLHVNFSRGWPAPAPIQPAVLVQPIVPAGQGLNGARGLPGGFPGQAGPPRPPRPPLRRRRPASA